MKTRILISMVTLLCLAVGVLEAKEKKRKENFKFSANKNTTLEISNKHGDIVIKNNANDKITIEVVVTTYELEKKRKYKISQEDIKVISKVQNNHIKVYTELPRKIKQSGKFSIDYQVQVPSYVDLNIKNSFGEVIAGEVSSNSEFSVSFGSLIIDKLVSEKNTSNTSKIKLSFASDCQITQAQNMELKMSHSECKVNKAKILKVSSSFSDLEAEEVEKLEMNSKHDHVDVIKLNDFLIKEGKFSDFNIDELVDKIEAKLDFSKLTIDDVNKDFEAIEILKKFGDIKISVDKDSKYLIDVKNEHGEIDLDHHVILMQSDGNLKKIIAKSFLEIDTSDIIPKIIIKSKHGGVKIDKSE